MNNQNKWKGSGLAGVATVLTLCLSAILCSSAFAQSKALATIHPGPSAYDVARESVVTGKVLKYSPATTTAPMGAHILLQTSSGQLDIQAGNARMIAASHLSLQVGDSLSITGENIPFNNGTVFVARVIQKGAQSVAVRSGNGMPLLPTARTADGRIVAPAGVR
jgi:hypothetical protein